MRDLDKTSSMEVPVFPWQAYHRVLQDVHHARWVFLRGQLRAAGRELKDLFCDHVHRLNIGFCQHAGHLH